MTEHLLLSHITRLEKDSDIKNDVGNEIIRSMAFYVCQCATASGFHIKARKVAPFSAPHPLLIFHRLLQTNIENIVSAQDQIGPLS